MATGAEVGDPEELFESLAVALLAEPAVSQGTGFGKSPGLRVGGKVFAMLVRGELVAKLPRERVDQLVVSGSAAPFDPGHGRVMKEWVSTPARHGSQWKQLADEALQFARGAAPR
ncbi:hypothetical protein BH20ACT24_BH20ACT24_04300 [soil metagenome]